MVLIMCPYFLFVCSNMFRFYKLKKPKVELKKIVEPYTSLHSRCFDRLRVVLATRLNEANLTLDKCNV